MSAGDLQRALGAIGLRGAVEARGALAILVLEEPGALGDGALRSAALALAREHGFTHLAVELDDGVPPVAAVRVG